MVIVFAGSIGRFTVGGHAWGDMQYLLGLKALGHEVYYLEECGEGSWVYKYDTDEVVTDLEYPTMYLKNCLESIGLANRWIYRAGNKSVGMSEDFFQEICIKADLLFIRACPLFLWRKEYEWPQRRIFIDSDPGFTQFGLLNKDTHLVNTVARCEHLFTIAQRIGMASCSVPSAGRKWLKTTHPIFLSHWPFSWDIPATDFTSVMQWKSYKEVSYQGKSYGNKDKEFSKFLDIPKRTDQQFKLALTGIPTQNLYDNSWKVVTGWKTTFTPELYSEFIRTSRAEFGIAKQGYVATRGGWFSDRSICYLASGKPVLVQDTGIADWLPIGEGILTFRDMSEALQGIKAINSNYEQHCRAARQLAKKYFATEEVLPPLLEAAMN
jgi:hypothetical protein